jgi:hypothetical protein
MKKILFLLYTFIAMYWQQRSKRSVKFIASDTEDVSISYIFNQISISKVTFILYASFERKIRI